MKTFNAVTLSVFAKPEEDAALLRQGLVALLPFDLVTENILLEDKSARGFNERTVHIITLTLAKDRHINSFVDAFTAKLNSQQRSQLVAEAESRLDSALVFFVRIDKELWASQRVVQLTETGSCYHLKFHVAAFPRKKEIAIEIATNIFKPSSVA